jgi:ubiquinone biosynthesis protein
VEGPLGGWYHDLGEIMVAGGIIAMVFVGFGIWRTDRGRGTGRR